MADPGLSVLDQLDQLRGECFGGSRSSLHGGSRSVQMSRTAIELMDAVRDAIRSSSPRLRSCQIQRESFIAKNPALQARNSLPGPEGTGRS